MERLLVFVAAISKDNKPIVLQDFSSNTEQRNDEKIKSLMQNLENLYVKTISNPFHDSNDFLSNAFVDKLQKLSSSYT